jgi:hypothetical protein
MVEFLIQLLLIVRSQFPLRVRLSRKSHPAPRVCNAQITVARETVEHRSLAVGVAVSTVPVAPGRDPHSSAGDRDPLAPTQLPRLLAVEVPSRRRPPRTNSEIRALIRRMSRENALDSTRGLAKYAFSWHGLSEPVMPENSS